MNSSNFLKIILAGLDNAGKTSMLVVLQKMYDFEEDVQKLKPTVRIEHFRREFLNYSLDINDMGGQSNYRQKYLDRKIYFEEVDAFLYLIDVQNKSRIKQSIEYLKKVLDILDEVEYDKNKPIFICFSKMDYEECYAELSEYVESLKAAIGEIKKTYPGFRFEFYSTSIYNVYSIVKVFSAAITMCVDKARIMQDLLSEFAHTYDFDEVLLYDQTGLIIAQYLSKISEFGNDNVIHSATMDRIISDNLDYFKKIEDEGNPDFKFFQRLEGDFINYGYKFEVSTSQFAEKDEKESDEQENHSKHYYVSIITRKDNESKYDWNTHELVDKCKVDLEK